MWVRQLQQPLMGREAVGGLQEQVRESPHVLLNFSVNQKGSRKINFILLFLEVFRSCCSWRFGPFRSSQRQSSVKVRMPCAARPSLLFFQP